MNPQYFYIPAMLIIASFSLWAILCDNFHDNLIQRIGLAMVCLGASVRVYTLFVDMSDLLGPQLLLANGIAIYAIGTAWKVWYHSNPRPTSDKSRKTQKTYQQ